MADQLSSVSPTGQVTIPLQIRRVLGVRPNDKVAFTVRDGTVRLEKAQSVLDAEYRSVPALKKRRSLKDLTQIAADEHAAHVAREGLER